MEYRERLARWRSTYEESDAKYRRIGNARLLTGLAAVGIAGLALGATLISAWWLFAPFFVFLALAVTHSKVDRVRSSAVRAVAYYERALARLENRWMGQGHTGDEYRDPKHLYAEDLDLFGPGSLFQLLSTARTSAGERTLADWLRSPGEPDVVRARQQAVAELRPRIDLREEIALMGEDVRAAVDDHRMRAWGTAEAIPFFGAARWIALVLAAAALVAFGLWMAQLAPVSPLLVVILLELIFGMLVRDSVRRVIALISAPAKDLELLGLLLARLEQEQFTSPRLQRLTHSLGREGRTPSAEIATLVRLVGHLDSARNQFFRLLAAPLVWVPQFAMAVERWRQAHGPHIGEWTAAVAEFEALCALASFAYDRPQSVFPELLDQAAPHFEAQALAHPLIQPGEAIANSVQLTSACPLWIVSGSNMSGKSTFLRSIGLGVGMAWAGAPVCAAQMRLSRLHVGASIRVNDSLADHKSRFYAEISRLRDIVDLPRRGVATLFLLDELLSGTNSHDRRIGAAAVIRQLVEHGAIGLVTTHDLALASIADTMNGKARNVHFEDHMEAGEIRFDYQLREGVVERSNALELMRAVGLDV